ncbi:MAG TPA: tripartite tricarboxylate transporter substrate-binding protein, partial [Pseudolabrys sp.]|nr:tripartite tricarboxylate transporter substrate-binding protein [Pseudolabrys sp.]
MFRVFSFLALISLLAPAIAQAEHYPDHPIRIIVGYAAGGAPDLQARTLAAQLSLDLGQQFFVENRTGANGTLGTRAVVQSKPDGYTMLFTSNGIAPTPFIYKNLGYDIFTDLTPVATIGVLDGLFMLVDAKSPYKTLAEFIDHAKKDRAIYGSPGVGNGLHLAGEIFSKKAGITMQHIPYKGASEVMTGMLSGSIEVMFVTPPSVMG